MNDALAVLKTIAKDLASNATLRHLGAELALAAASIALGDVATYFTSTALDPQTALIGRAAVGFAKRVVDAASEKVNATP